MRLPKFEYRAPATLAETLAILKELGPAAVVAAGGTDLVPRLRQRLVKPDVVVSLKNLSELATVRVDGLMLKMGARAGLKSVMDHPETVSKLPALAEALKSVGAAAIQHHAGTIGGNLLLNTRCIHYNQSDWWRSGRERCYKHGGQVCHAVKDGKECAASNQSDGATMLTALSALVAVKSAGGERMVPIGELFSGKGDAPFTLAPGELLTEIQVMLPPPGAGASYQKLRWRSAIDFPLVSAAAVTSLSRGKVDRVRLVIGGAGPKPMVVDEADRLLRGREPSDDLIGRAAEAAGTQVAGTIVENAIAPAEYRRRMAPVMARRALSEATRRAMKG